MATRATYEIDGTPFYCHWDGYPTGAAQRFAAMIKAHIVASKESIDCIERRNGGYPYAFIRGVMDAEPTEGHDAHGDTEFRYTMKSAPNGATTIRVEERTGAWSLDKPPEFRVQFFGDLAEWLDKMRGNLETKIRNMKSRYPTGPLSCPDDPSALALDSIPLIARIEEHRDYCKTPQVIYATRENALKIRDAFWAQSQKFQTDNPNKKIYEDKAKAWSMAYDKAA